MRRRSRPRARRSSSISAPRPIVFGVVRPVVRCRHARERQSVHRRSHEPVGANDGSSTAALRGPERPHHVRSGSLSRRLRAVNVDPDARVALRNENTTWARGPGGLAATEPTIRRIKVTARRCARDELTYRSRQPQLLPPRRAEEHDAARGLLRGPRRASRSAWATTSENPTGVQDHRRRARAVETRCSPCILHADGSLGASGRSREGEILRAFFMPLAGILEGDARRRRGRSEGPSTRRSVGDPDRRRL